MLDLFTIATKLKALEDQCRVWDIPDFNSLYQARPGSVVPVLINENGEVRWHLATWGLLDKGSTVSQVKMQKILTRRPYNILLRTHRCAIPANCFFGRRGKDTVRLIRILKMRTFLIGGICSPDADGYYRFALLTTEPADILNDSLRQMPVVTKCHHAKDWLQTSDMKRVMHYADRSGNYWFDFFKVTPEIAISTQNHREMLKPLGISFQQWQDREEKLQSLQFKDDRINRGNTKGRH